MFFGEAFQSAEQVKRRIILTFQIDKNIHQINQQEINWIISEVFFLRCSRSSTSLVGQNISYV